MSPSLGLRKEAKIGARGNEREGTGSDRSDGAGGEWRVEGSGRSGFAGSELPSGQAAGAALSGAGSGGAQAWKCGAGVAQRDRAGETGRGLAAGAGALRRRGRRTFRSHFGRRASGARAWLQGACGDAAALDAGSGLMESGAEAQALSQEAGGQGAFRRVGATGWKSSPLAGRARAQELSDESGG